jgi:flagellar motor switch protein FliG
MNPIILSIYGTGDKADYIAVSTFEDGRGATNYVKMVESQELPEGKWVRTEWVESWQKYDLKPERKIIFKDLMSKLDDRSIQKMMREIDSQELAFAMKGEDSDTQEIFFRNMSKRAANMIKEDMEYMGPIRREDQQNSQKKIISIYSRLQNLGEIPDAFTPTSELVE